MSAPAVPPFPPDARRNVILCEGFQDRAFWKGLLTNLDCGESRKDPLGRTVTGGRYGYRSPAGRYVEVVPADSRQKLIKLLRGEVRDAGQPPILGDVIFNFDPDTADAAAVEGVAVSQADNLAGLLAADAPDGAPIDRPAPTSLRLPGTDTTIFVLPWRCDPPDGDGAAAAADRPGVPGKQTLERLACAAVTEIYEERGEAVADWLADSRVTPPAKHTHKAAAMALMAGWHPDRGSEGFFEAVWDDPAVRPVLLRLLAEAGLQGAVGRLLG